MNPLDLLSRQSRVENAVIVGRALIMLAQRGQRDFARDALSEQGEHAAADLLRRSVVAGLGSQTGVSDPAVQSFLNLVSQKSIRGRLLSLGAHRAVFERPTISGTPAVASFCGEGSAQPSLAPVVTSTTLHQYLLVALAILTNEATHRDGAEQWVTNLLVDALAAADDLAFIDPNNTGGSGIEPAAITHGANAIHITGSHDAAADLSQMVSVYPGRIGTAVWILSAISAARLCLRQAAGTFSNLDLSVRQGGELCGLPCLVSQWIPETSNGGFAALADADALLIAQDDNIELARSTQSAVLMSTSPSEPAALTSLWQVNSSAIRALTHVSWQTTRPSVVYCDGTSW